MYIKDNLKSKKIKAVVLDLDDTMYVEMDYIRSGFSILCDYLKTKGIKANLNDFVSCFKTNAKDAINDYMDTLSIHDDVLENSMLNIHRAHIPNIKPMEGLLEFLQYVKSKGVLLGVISDGTPLAQNNKLIGLKVINYFDKIVFSDSIGGSICRKPCDVSFRYICKFFDINFDEMLYIGDNCDRDFYPVDHLGASGIQILNKHGIYYGKIYRNNVDNYFELKEVLQSILEETL